MLPFYSLLIWGCFIAFIVAVEPEEGIDWEYDSGPDRPENWYLNYPVCLGSRQSPINIPPLDEFTQRISGLLPTFEFDYLEEGDYELFGERTTLKVEIPGEFDNFLENAEAFPFINGRSDEIYPQPFRLAQFHFHWGADDSVGSEHQIYSTSYAVELHLVHFNTRYDNLLEAAGEKDGLLVVSVMFEANTVKTVDEFLSPILNELEDGLFEEGSSVEVEMNLQGLLNSIDTSQYFSYPGSLTTPPCSETVTWVIIEKPLSISPSVSEKFRAYKNITRNYRPLQENYGRRILNSITNSFLELEDGNLTTREASDLTSSVESGLAIVLTFAVILLLLGWVLYYMEVSRD